MKAFKRITLVILSLILALSLLLTSCSSKFGNVKAASEGVSNVSAGEETLRTVEASDMPDAEPSSGDKAPADIEELINKEMNDLSISLVPYLDPSSAFYAGDENMEYLQDYLLKPEGLREPINAGDWEKAVRILFFFGDEDATWIKGYITDFVSNERIERQYALSGLMKLISLRYPLSLGGDMESLKKSDEIADIEILEDTHQILARQAYCLGLSDITVETGKIFRPNDALTKGEAVSMLHRILKNLGLPILASTELPAADEPKETVSTNPPSELPGALTIEDIRQEYQSYTDTLRKSNSSEKQKRLEQLTQAETILAISFTSEEIIAQHMTIDQWKKIFNEVFSIDTEKIDPYLSYETGGTLPYDVAAISIFKLSYLFGGFDIRDASSDEIEKARAAVPQFDTARDISKFAQMFSSGLLEGLYQAPGFTPQRPVSNVEGILIIKRMLESM